MPKDSEIQIVNTDFLVIGSGIAGLSAALETSRKGKKPLVLSKSHLGKASNTYLAGGLFSAAFEGYGAEKHIEKTIASGKGMNNRALVNTFVNEARKMIQELNELGMNGIFQPSGFATRGSSLVGGPHIVSALLKACRKGGVGFVEDVIITDLVVQDRTCLGAVGFKKRTGDLYGFRAGAVLLATGGAGAIYARHDNAPGMTGDGYGLALEAGLELIDMEFVQFYSMVYARSGKARMIIPPSFADAGRLLNRTGEDLKSKYGLQKKPLALVYRDRLAQALFREIGQGNDVDGALLLDMTKAEDERIPLEESLRRKFKKILGYDLRPILITPASHHTMGGIPIDRSGRTAIGNLFGAGEVVGGVHGANRMGGNALSEALVFGALSARSAIEDMESKPTVDSFIRQAKRCVERNLLARWRKGARVASTSSLMERLKQTLWQNAGIVRSAPSLDNALHTVDEVLLELEKERAGRPQELLRIIECRNAALSARSIIAAAIAREETRGAHYREDFPDEREEWLKTIHVGLIQGRPEVVRIVPVPM